ncbi:AAA family ATPase [Paenibacillus ginsengarvi]|uniref:ATP-binding protein n=1 Tax=Paenibacillus ginsengarvi TaxID=400777 RepID=A0A3B0BDI7_9BACL|nr:ATP-binding protein [Paenibacillus ginsengarvi]
MFFLQMSGYPGSGKSTLAKAIAARTGAVIVDHDVVKSALLGAMASRVPDDAGGISYEIDWALVEFQLSLGRSVIMDSPCLYSIQLEKGTALAERYRVRYKYVECFLGDNQIRDHRLKTRERKISQVGELPAELKNTILTPEQSKSIRPSEARYVIVDTEQALESYIEEVEAYLKE